MILSVLYYSLSALLLLIAGAYLYIAGTFPMGMNLYLFIAGACIFMFLRLFIKRMCDAFLFAETFQHEFTHMAFAYLTFVRVYDFSSSLRRGGHIKTNRVNLILTLSPYTVPLFPILIGLLCFIVKAMYVKPLIVILGFAMMQYFFTLIKDISAGDQPDLKVYGKLRSRVLILLCALNTLLYSYLILVNSFSIVYRMPVYVIKELMH